MDKDCPLALRRRARTIPRLALILIIDDDQDSRDALAAFLGKAGHDVRCAGNGREALAALSDDDHVPDAALLDVRMPGMDGIAVLGVMRSYLRWASLPVAIFTAYPEDPRLWHVAEAGVTRVFAKAKTNLDEVLEWVNDQPGRAAPPGGDADASAPQFPS